MDLIKISKNQNHFIPKKAKRAVEVVLTRFLFYQYLLGKNQSKNKYTRDNPRRDNILSGYFIWGRHSIGAKSNNLWVKIF